MRRIDLIVIHCTASRPDQHISLGMLDQMHKARGWKCCGYHYYITRDGQLHFGRPEDEKGRAADTRTPAQKKALLTLLCSLKQDYPNAEIVGHCELEGVHKACPSFSVSELRVQMKQLGY